MNSESGQPLGSEKFCIARQPILDSQCNVVAYELLFRQVGEGTVASDTALATLSVVHDTFANIDVETVLGNKKAYICFDSNTMEGDMFGLLSASDIVLEIVKPAQTTDHVMQQLKMLKEHGYCLALDDFSDDIDSDPRLKICDIVKLNVSAHSELVLVQHIESLRSKGKELLAWNVETYEHFEMCQALGCSLFQGSFFTKPTKLIQADLPASTLHILDIMNNIMADAETAFLEHTISHDVSLSYSLLRFVNSAGLSCGRELRTVKQALSMLGRNQLYRWLSVMLFSSKEDKLNQTNALLIAALYRGRLMELFAEYTELVNPNELFILGAFSYLEALLNRNMGMIIKDMLIPARIKQALIEKDGRYWPYLSLALTIDRGDTGEIQAAANNLGLTLNDINRVQLMATAYSETVA